MNDRDLAIRRNNATRELLHTSKISSHRNCIRINVNNSLEHEIAKLKICYDLIKQGKQVITEAVFENNSRADILVLDDHKIIEILHSENEKDCLEKCKKYPAFELEMIRV